MRIHGHGRSLMITLSASLNQWSASFRVDDPRSPWQGLFLLSGGQWWPGPGMVPVTSSHDPGVVLPHLITERISTVSGDFLHGGRPHFLNYYCRSAQCSYFVLSLVTLFLCLVDVGFGSIFIVQHSLRTWNVFFLD